MEHSKKFASVKDYYDKGYWNKRMVKEAVNKWITAEEYFEITGEEY